MIVIKNIEYIETDKDPLEIISTKMPHNLVGYTNKDAPITVEYLTELIHGRRFVRPDGRTLYIGVSEQAQEVIGIQYGAWNTKEREMQEWVSAYQREKTKVDMYRSAKLWKRIKYLFTGII